ncbi:hypothetical protein AX774_g6140 [Zancudomyces culisetae]|uniref:Hyaluronan/mRNA-binding protein domain-containing protein n=1 Tax=Zancudomyces culisetae TaxID=1213189 RepID=A0A1R1PHG6_ZANCU|nr:hypothetical protein AX774_g6140 [Zancudomyces culisetae]|eukprot:OMH80420.1 hypothetical protein AX774_g6140 [Zancudomyces culisetae]
MSSSTATRNPFELLQDDVQDAEVNFAVKASKDKKAKPTETKPVKAAPEAPKSVAGGQRRPQGGNRDAAYRGGDRARPAVREGVERPAPRGGDSRGFRGKSGRGGRGGAAGSRRPFDRHSATGLEDSEKKTRVGWLGEDSALVKDQSEAAALAKEESKDVAADQEAAEVPAAEVDTTKTLEEYRKEQTKVVAPLAESKDVRKANEGGIDSKVLKASSVLVRSEEDFFAAKTSSKAKKASKQQREKVPFELPTHFAAPERPRRGGKRDEKPRSRTQRPRGTGLNVNDTSAFPSLS